MMAAGAHGYFDALADRYDALLPWPAALAARVAELVAERVGSGAAVLEIGAGTGRLAVELAVRTGRYVGTDAAAAMVGMLVSRLRAAGRDGVAAVAAAGALPFAAATFDAVVSSGVLLHLADVPAAVRELGRVLRPAGVYVHCHQRERANAVARTIDALWRARIAELSVGRGVPTMRESAVLDEVLTLGAADADVVAAAWTRTSGVRDYLDRYAGRVRDLYADVAADRFDAVVRAFARDVRSRCDDADELRYDIEFVVTPVVVGAPSAAGG